MVAKLANLSARNKAARPGLTLHQGLHASDLRRVLFSMAIQKNLTSWSERTDGVNI